MGGLFAVGKRKSTSPRQSDYSRRVRKTDDGRQNITYPSLSNTLTGSVENALLLFTALCLPVGPEIFQRRARPLFMRRRLSVRRTTVGTVTDDIDIGLAREFNNDDTSSATDPPRMRGGSARVTLTNETTVSLRSSCDTNIRVSVENPMHPDGFRP